MLPHVTTCYNKSMQNAYSAYSTKHIGLGTSENVNERTAWTFQIFKFIASKSDGRNKHTIHKKKVYWKVKDMVGKLQHITYIFRRNTSCILNTQVKNKKLPSWSLMSGLRNHLASCQG